MSDFMTLRPAVMSDCADLAVFADMATRRLTSHLWGLGAGPGQSALARGRDIIRNDINHFSHYLNWRVARVGDALVGGYNACVLPPAGTDNTSPEVVRGLNALKSVAAGTWYLTALAVYPEHQGQGFGRAILAAAEGAARQSGAKAMTLMVGSFNTAAHALYLRVGFREWDRRPFTPFPGSDPQGDWILMVKDLA